MIIVDGKQIEAQDKVREEATEHPLVKRRRQIEQAFLDELTRLTRKYGLELKADTRMSYGETYPEHKFVVPYEGTEGRYVEGHFGVGFEAVGSKEALSCTDDERKQFERAKADREAEDQIISQYERKLSSMHWDMMEQAQRLEMDRFIAEQADKPKTFSCNCGEQFKSKASLEKHVKTTGHVVSILTRYAVKP